MDLATVLSPLINEVVHDLGPWAVVPCSLGGMVYELRRRFLAKDVEIARLRNQVHDLQDKRLADAREMIRIAEAGAAATKTRTESDQRFADLLEALLRRNAGGLFGGRR